MKTLFKLAVLLALPVVMYGQQWELETADQSGAGSYTALKIDAQGNAHLAYILERTHTLKYAYRDAGTHRWFAMAIAEGASFCDISLDSKGHPYISWADFGTQNGAKLRYAFWDGAAWQKRLVPLSSNAVGYYTSIALDEHDFPTLSFYELRGPDGTLTYRMRTVTWNGKYWEARTIDNEDLSGKFNSVAADSAGHLHLAYATMYAVTASVRYAYWDGQHWNREVVDDLHQGNNQGLVGESIHMAVDALGQPHLSYANYSNPTLKYAVRKAGKWEIQSVDRMAGVAYPDRNSIVVNRDGRPYLGYYDSGLRVLKVAWPEGTKWVTEVVDSNEAGFTSSMQIHNDVLWISYADPATGGVKVAHRNLPAPAAGKDARSR